MTKIKTSMELDRFFKDAKAWQEELKKLRAILLSCGLEEEFKWSKPCYTAQGANVVVLLPLKNWCALLFCQGALIDDGKGMLIRPSENTQAARQIRFTSLREINEREAAVKAYVRKAMAARKEGLEVVYKKTSDFKIPEELREKLEKLPMLKAAFSGLTPGRQRGYILHFSAPRNSSTRERRIEKCLPEILQGRGLNDDKPWS